MKSRVLLATALAMLIAGAAQVQNKQVTVRIG